MAAPTRIQEMPAIMISELLSAIGDRPTEGLAADLQDFIEQIGGVENAWAAVKMLREFEETS